jgi:hypothetical protein
LGPPITAQTVASMSLWTGASILVGATAILIITAKKQSDGGER